MKKIKKVAFVAAFAAVAGYGVYTNQRTETMSDLMLANVEALASGESDADPNTFMVIKQLIVTMVIGLLVLHVLKLNPVMNVSVLLFGENAINK